MIWFFIAAGIICLIVGIVFLVKKSPQDLAVYRQPPPASLEPSMGFFETLFPTWGAGHMATRTGRLSQAYGSQVEIEGFKRRLYEADMEADLRRAINDNKILIAEAATAHGIPLEAYGQYLLRLLDAKVFAQQTLWKSKIETETKRISITETIKLALTESNLKFDERLQIIEQLETLETRLLATTHEPSKKRIEREIQVLEAKLAGQQDLPKTDGEEARGHSTSDAK